MSWQFFVAISVTLFSVSTIIQRVFLRDRNSDPIAYSIVFQLVIAILIGIYALLNGFKLPADMGPFWGNFLAMIVLYSLSNVFIFKSLKLIEVSEYTILFATRVLWGVAGGILVLGEAFSPRQVFGTLIIFISVAIVSWRSKAIKFGRGEIYALLAAAFFGSAFVNDALIIRRNFDVPSYVAIAFLLPGLAVWLINPRAVVGIKRLVSSKLFIKFILWAAIYAISAVTAFMAYNVGRNAAQLAPLNQISTILIVLLGIVFLKERAFLARKILGATLSFIGVILVK